MIHVGEPARGCEKPRGREVGFHSAGVGSDCCTFDRDGGAVDTAHQLSAVLAAGCGIGMVGQEDRTLGHMMYVSSLKPRRKSPNDQAD